MRSFFHIMANILLFIYNLILTGLYYLLYPILGIYFHRLKYQDALKGFGSNSQGGILLHAASVGEVNAIKPLVVKLLDTMPHMQICITTTSVTGRKQAAGINPKIYAYLSSLDVKHLRYSQLNSINPSLICIVETEIWPNLLCWAKHHRVPILFLNARLSNKSAKRYSWIKGLIHFLTESVRGVFTQSELDSIRFREIVSCPVEYLGNIKLSVQLPEHDVHSLRSQWGYGVNDLVICWGSSRPGEEALMVSIGKELKQLLPNLKLIIAPRHPKRIKEVLECCQGFPYDLWSEVGKWDQNAALTTRKDLFIIDVLGLLDQAYAICDIAIIGGSFYDFGGHNPLEAAFYAKPIVIGQYHQSCQDSVKQLILADGIVVSNSENLASDILTLAHDPDKRQQLGQRAKKVLTENRNTVDKYLEKIRSIVD